MFKAKIVAIFLVPAVALYSAAAALIYGDANGVFDLKALQTTAIMSLACALAQDILPRSFKEAVVFWRFRHRLPSHRAFLRKQTDRYDLTNIVNHKQLAELPPAEQQLIFYNRIYKKHRSDPTVAQSSFRYSAWRDTSSLFLLLAVLTIPAAYSISIATAHPFEWKSACVLAASAAVAYLLTALAARQVANSFVGLVLACETAEPPHGISC